MNDDVVLSNWRERNGVDLSKVLTYSSDKESSIDDIDVGKCVCLLNEDGREDFTSNTKPELEMRFKSHVRQIDVFSEGSLVEVFGVDNEYLCTCESSFIDDWEGMAVYHAKIVFPGLPTCKLKFARIKDPSRFWLYGIQLRLDKGQETVTPKVFNMDNVNHLLNSSSQQISARAERFKNLLEMCVNNSSGYQAGSASARDQVFNLNNLRFALSAGPKLGGPCNRAGAIGLDMSNGVRENGVGAGAGAGAGSVKVNPDVVEELKAHVDRKMVDLKEELVQHIDRKVLELKEDTRAQLEQIKKLLEARQ